MTGSQSSENESQHAADQQGAGPQEQDGGAEGRQQQRWYAMDAERVLEEVGSGQDGLDQQEAEQRLERHGRNSIGGGEEVPWWRVLLGQFTSPLIYVLVAALVVTLAIQEWGDATVIGLVLLVNTVVGFIQEYKAENAIQALMAMVAPKARVRRGGEEQEIESDQLVPGDIVLLGEGSMVPADCRLVSVEGLQVNEAALTGESVPVDKQAEALDESRHEPQPGDQLDMAFMNTAVTSGTGIAVVVATGEDTQVGRIAQSLREEDEDQTPLQARMDRLARFIALAILI
ncbi:MAG: HAD-IC family P-type ATPase, partial [Planctomycetota bacterium]